MFSQCKVDIHKFTRKQVDKKRFIIQEGKSKVKLDLSTNTRKWEVNEQVILNVSRYIRSVSKF